MSDESRPIQLGTPDIAIVGGGLAGLSCAARAAELGAKVIVFEQGEGDDYPCNSRYSGGMLHLDYHDVDSPVEALVASLLSRSPNDVRRDLIELIASNVRHAIRWLESTAGARFVRVGPQPYEKWVLAPPRPPKPGLIHPGRGPGTVLKNLASHACARGAEFRRGAQVTGISATTDGFHVRTLEAGHQVQTATKAVVFADGGFQANEAMLAQHISPNANKLLQRNARTGCGTSLQILTGLGAEMSDLRSFYGHLVSRNALEDVGLWPYPMIDGLASFGLLVGPDGRRFADEGKKGVYLANQVARRADPTDATVIFDDTTWWSIGRETRVPPNPILTNRGGQMHSAGSLAELAEIAGIDPLALADTVRLHNESVGTGGTLTLDPPRTFGTRKPGLITTAPFHAVPVCAGITYTMGGVMIGADAAIRSIDGGVLPGLFAAGAAVGGIEGGESSFYIGGLCKALVLGLVSAEGAVAHCAIGNPT